MFCTLCGELCKGCSVKIHAFRAMSSHTVVPYDEKASVSPICVDHGEEALLYCPVDSSVICSRCRMEAHKTHSGVTSLQEAAVKKTSDQQAVLEQINALDPVVAGIKLDHDFLLKGLTTAREEVETYFQKAQQDLISQRQQVQLRLDEHEAKLGAEFAEKFRVCAELQATRVRILKLYEGNKLQILEAPMIEMCAQPEVEPCTVLFHLSLDNHLPKLSVECVRQSVRVGHRLDVWDKASRDENKWRTATVREVGPKNFKIGYDGWSEKWDEWIEVGSGRYVNFGLHTKGRDTSARADQLSKIQILSGLKGI